MKENGKQKEKKEMTRICSICKIEKSLLDCFYKEKGTKAGKDGYGRRCKDCERIRKYKWSSIPEVRKRHAESRKTARKNLSPEEKEKLLEKERIWHKTKRNKNPNYRIRATERQRQWRKEHSEEYRLNKKIYKHLRRARRWGQLGDFTKEEWVGICEQHDYRCAICKERKDLTIDHIIPLSKGGTHEKDNIQPLCMACNQKKYDYLPEELSERFGFEVKEEISVLYTSVAARTSNCRPKEYYDKNLDGRNCK